MLIQLLELTVTQANLIALLLPIIVACLFILIIPYLKEGSTSKLRMYLSYLIKPPRIGSLVIQDGNVESRSRALWREIKVRLYFVYIAIAVFLVGFMISEFYQVMFDLSLPVTQGSTGEIRTVTSVVLMSPFEAGWMGTLPWYGQLPAPAGLGTYHTSWSWVFMTASYTDNPDFLNTVVLVMLLISIIGGIVFLAPLASKTIRKSFFPSMFFFVTGMMVFTKTSIDCIAHAIGLALGGQIQYGIGTATGDMIPNLIQGIAIGFPIVLAMYCMFAVLGWKLWKVHYEDTKSRHWFAVYITMSFWLGLVLSILMVM
jgi:hypothetical protein